ncbi:MULTISPECIES: peptidase T [Clostridia]|jgi:tripeptide aminopeptidase|uniref:peptidase T n=1 Tax=Clostridia TaxID=186801 RepID=UPI000E4AA8E7|nr:MULTISPECIES: peptidase T [Clostridia]RHV01366.1 peptidase T [Firmicutes bacterium OM07-11]RKQ29194.1 peptidase T [Ruminococcus sp. B05]TAP32677.1 peptidase T [Mediterraneibacter sp. gm002]
MKAYERLLEYARIWTTSDEESTTSPTTSRQFDLAKQLVEEMKEIGIEDAYMDEFGYVYGHIPATPGYEERTAIGFIAHMDTAPDYSGENVNPQIIENYDGNDVSLGTSGKVLSVAEFPSLKTLTGRTLITTDGTTLLGADDKAGIAEIMTVAEELIKENIPHGKVSISFTTDEEVGSGAKHMNLEVFGAPYAYTVDGGPEGEIQFENFNAASADFYVHGVNVHPGEAKGIMKNSQKIAMEIQGMLPVDEAPEYTEGYEGFFHLMEMTGTVEETKMSYLIRDFNSESYENRKELLRNITEIVNKKYGEGTVELKLNDSYRNMREKIEPCMELIEYAKKACEMAEVKADIAPIRGGTDGARLSFVGLPCPNLGTGGYGFHGAFEHITAEGMDKATVIIKNIILQFAE